jgi:hypothetical protein
MAYSAKYKTDMETIPLITDDHIHIAETSKRLFSDFADYAAQQGAPVEAFKAFGWRQVTRKGRPVLEYPTLTGPRWRYLDGHEPRHESPSGYKACWYGLNEALALAGADRPLVLVNGAAGVVAAQYHGIPAFAVSDGESRVIPANMIETLQSVWRGEIWIAQDCDATGRESAAKRARQLIDAGFIVRALDLRFGEHGDIADFCKVYGSAALERLDDLPEIAPTAPPEPHQQTEYNSDVTSKIEEWLRDEVLPAANAALSGNQKHSLCINPAHRESHASARLGKATRAGAPLKVMYYCTCGSHNLLTVAKWLGLDFKTWVKAKYPHSQKKRSAASATPTVEAQKSVLLPALGVSVKKVNRVTDDPELAASLKADPVILIQGATGIGKTYAIAEHSKTYTGDFTGLAQYRLLTIAGAKANEAEHYETASGKYISSFKHAQRIYTSINSAPKFGRRGGLFQVDEIEQCIQWALNSKTIENARIVWNELKASWSSAAQLIGMDANLSPITVQLLERWTGKRAKVFAYARDSKPREITLYQNRNATLEKLQKVLNRRAGLVGLGCSSEKLATETAERMTEQGYKVLKITGDNSQLPAIQAAITNADQRAGFDLIVYTSAAGAGVDFSEEFYASFVILDAQPLTPEEGIQLQGRVRNAKHYFAFCPTERDIKSTPSAAELIAAKMLEFRQTGAATGRPLAVSPTDIEMLSVWADFEERRKRESANFRAYFIARLQANGFKVREVTTKASSVFVAELDAYREKRSDEDWQYVRDHISLPPDELKRIELNRQEITRELKLRNTRWKIEFLLDRLALTENERFLMESRGRKAIRLGAELLLPAGVLLETDVSEESEGIPIHRRQFRQNRQACIFQLLQLAKFSPDQRGYHDLLEWIFTTRPTAEIDARFAQWATPEGLELFQRAFGHYGNNAKTPRGLLRLFFEKLGFDLKNEKQGSGENYTRVYSMDTDAATYILGLQNEAARAILKAQKHLDEMYSKGSYIHIVKPPPLLLPEKPLLPPNGYSARRKAAGLSLNPYAGSVA